MAGSSAQSAKQYVLGVDFWYPVTPLHVRMDRSYQTTQTGLFYLKGTWLVKLWESKILVNLQILGCPKFD